PYDRENYLWRKIGEPGPGAHCRGYVRLSYQASDSIEGQKQKIQHSADERGWIMDGFDIEPARSANYEDIESRPVFAEHLRAAERGEFRVSICHMNDRWARNIAVAYASLSRLRKAGVYWATADGKWNIDRIGEDGSDAAFAQDVAQNAAYSRKVSEKTRIGKQIRAAQGFRNGDISYGYQPPTSPLKPPGSSVPGGPRGQPDEPHPQEFARLQQMGEWLADALSDGETAAQCNARGWMTRTAKAVGPARKRRGTSADDNSRLVHEHVGPRPFSKDTIRAIRLRWYHREFAPGSGKGTILTPDGQRVEGKHVAAWSWELWHRIDEATALRQGSRGQRRNSSAAPTGHLWLFSGLVVCAACGNRLRADGNSRATGTHYGYYRDQAQARGLA